MSGRVGTREKILFFLKKYTSTMAPGSRISFSKANQFALSGDRIDVVSAFDRFKRIIGRQDGPVLCVKNRRQ